jgi:hypothetical protein
VSHAGNCHLCSPTLGINIKSHSVSPNLSLTFAASYGQGINLDMLGA